MKLSQEVNAYSFNVLTKKLISSKARVTDLNLAIKPHVLTAVAAKINS